MWSKLTKHEGQIKSQKIPGHNTQKKQLSASTVSIIALCLLLFLMFFSVTQGVSNISLRKVIDAFFHFKPENSQHLIIVDLRLPRVLASAFVGAAFAVAGAIMQGTTRNPMADSGLLGLNAGAGLALAIGFAFFPNLTYLQKLISAFVGAGMGVMLVNSISSVKEGENKPMKLVLAGAAVSALLTALSQGLALYMNVSQSLMFWTVGGVAAINWQQLFILLPWIVGGILLSLLLSKSISMLSLGEDLALSLGVNVERVHRWSMVTVLILAGAAVSVVGAVGFVGLIIPHIARFLIGVDYRKVIPVSAVLGALLMTAADLGARMVNPPVETPIGALISLIGVPFFLYLASKQRRDF